MHPLAALALQIEWGADEALDDLPVDRTRPAELPTARKPTTGVVEASKPASPPAVSLGTPGAILRPGAVARAQQAAAAAPTIDALRDALATFTDCPLAATATSLVFSDGNPDAGLVLVGEAPGAEEDMSGRPFSGPAGELLDRMLASIGIDRSHALLTCLIPWRPPGNRPVTDTEVQICLPFLQRHLTLVRPKVIVTLGQLPSRALTGRNESIRRMRGRWHETSIDETATKVPVLATHHPRALLGTPLSKREAWADLLLLRIYLDQR